MAKSLSALMLEIKRYFSDTLRQVYYRANKLKTALNKIAEVVSKLNNPDFSSASGPLTNKLQEHFNEFNKLTSQDEKEEINDIITIYQNKYNSKLKAEVEKYLAPQKKTQEKTQDILDKVIETTANEPDTPTTIETHNSPTPKLADKKNIPTPSPKQPPVEPNTQILRPTVTPQSRTQVDELLSSLEGKNYSPEQIAILRQVFKTMLVVCSSSDKKKIIQLMEIAVNSL